MSKSPGIAVPQFERLPSEISNSAYTVTVSSTGKDCYVN
jgi:hypothetical protein